MQVVEVGGHEVALGLLVTAPTVVPRRGGPLPASVRGMAGELLRVDVGDLTFDVRVDGPEDGRPVLLLHGFPETSASWAAVTPAAHRRPGCAPTRPTSSATPPAPGRARSTPTRCRTSRR